MKYLLCYTNSLPKKEARHDSNQSFILFAPAALLVVPDLTKPRFINRKEISYSNSDT
jgi:hypothetical protein